MEENSKQLVKKYIQYRKLVSTDTEIEHIEILNLENEDFPVLVSFVQWLENIYPKSQD